MVTKLNERLGVLLVFALLSAPPVAVALQDPTRPLQMPDRPQASQAGGLRLESVLISEQRRLAVINGQTLRENDSIGAGRVVRILPGVVEIRQEDKILRLEMHSNIRMPKDRR